MSGTSAELAPIHVFTQRPPRPLDLSPGNKENVPEHLQQPHRPTATRRRSSFFDSQRGLARSFRVSNTIRAQRVRSSMHLHRSGSGSVERTTYNLEDGLMAELSMRFGEDPPAGPWAFELSTGLDTLFIGRGLSAEEKRTKLLELFHETLKELEKLAPKMKGIGEHTLSAVDRLDLCTSPVSQSVKEVLQSLVDDNLVQSDKVGASNFFWSFPSQHGAALMNRVNAAKKQNQILQANISEVKNLIEQERVAERTAFLALLAEKTSEIEKLRKELAQYGSCDPVQVEAKRRAIALAHEAAVRWTVLDR
ncbi:hypothetical protein Clacol_000790 [Clathrus columnatus]|uniref:Mnd1 HTH domain-containing protein n=1 Tax=Clathrus columnatus TaxID=1419009 RepID=A0AAV4ZZK9_9AGAM|nr:hypothetical protein Clacol_000790 [Clathrus columnatus]